MVTDLTSIDVAYLDTIQLIDAVSRAILQEKDLAIKDELVLTRTYLRKAAQKLEYTRSVQRHRS
ncbi:MAG: hypothetical protein ACW99U_16605 [Candidatus Thorarchaeota archaeon]